MADANQSLWATLLTFRDIAAPLMNAVTETGGINANIEGRAEHTPENHAALFAQLMELTGSLSKKSAQQLGVQGLPENDWVRWHLAVTIATLVASYYRATAQPIAPDTAETFIASMTRAARDISLDATPQEAVSPASRVRAVGGLIPALSAIARFAFGRPEVELMAEIADRLRKEAEALTGKVTGGVENVEKQQLYDGLLEALGKIYAEAHYAEMDRLLDMPPDERAKYVQSHDNKPPIEPVWQAFQLRLNMLKIVAENLYLTDGSRVHPPE